MRDTKKGAFKKRKHPKPLGSKSPSKTLKFFKNK
jgi:hypothetical protein